MQADHQRLTQLTTKLSSLVLISNNEFTNDGNLLEK